MSSAWIDPQETLANIVLHHPGCAPVLQKHNLEFCCDGDQPLAQACRRQQVPLQALVDELNGAALREPLRVDGGLEAISTAGLVRYLEAQHAALAQLLPFLAERAQRVADLHGAKRPRLKELAWNVRDLSDALAPHLEIEARLLARALESDDLPGLVRPRELASLEEDHAELGDLLADLRLTTQGFRIEPGAGPEERALFSELESTEGQLMRTVHLENHLLLPRLL